MGFESKYNWEKIDRVILAHPELANGAIARRFGCAASTISWRRSQLGLKKMELEYWTPVMVKWLLQLYPFIGDYEMALIFDEAYPKAKGWTLKHIEKKRKYLGLKRTREQLQAIKARNKAFGCWRVGSLHTWQTRYQDPVGTVKVWDNRYSVIKTESGFERLMRYTWEQHYGPIPKGMNVVRRDGGKPEDDIRNLELISNADLARRNARGVSQSLSDGWVAGIMSHKDPELRAVILKDKPLLEAKRQSIILNRVIHDCTTGAKEAGVDGG